MTREEAKEILLLYRPDTRDAEDPEVQAALAQAKADPELQSWLTQHLSFQKAIRAKLRELPEPPDLKARILAERKIVRPRAFWLQPAVWAAAAAVVVLAGLGALVLREPTVPDRFANFQQRMVGTALRQYSMDLLTDDMGRLREFIARGGAPADYEVPEGLKQLALTGGGLLKWRNHPVSMVCFDQGNKQMLFLFVIERGAVKDPPPEAPQVEKVNELQTASWSRGDKTYVLAGPEDADFVRKYFKMQ